MKDQKSWNNRPIPEILFLISIFITFFVVWDSHNRTQRINRESFNTIEDSLIRTLETRISFYENTLQQTKAFFMQDTLVTTEDFRIYVNNVGLIRKYPGMTAIAYAEYVPSSRLDGFVNQMRAQGQKNYQVWPLEKDREFYTPVKFVEPFFNVIKELRGFDLVSNPERRQTMLQSAQEGTAVVTDEVDLLVKNVNSRGFNIFVPVYNGKTSPLSESERIQETKGYVIGIFSAQHLFNTILNEGEDFKDKVAFKIYTSEVTDKSLIYDSSLGIQEKTVPEPQFLETTEVTIGNKKWIIEVESLKTLEQELESSSTFLILMVGLIGSFLIWFMAYKLQKRRAELFKSKEKFRKIASSNSLLLEASNTIGTSLDIDIILESFAEFLTHNICECCLIQVIKTDSEKTSEVYKTHKAGKVEVCEKICTDFLNDTDYSRILLQNGKRLYVTDSKVLKDFSFLSIPIFIKDTVAGAVTLFFDKNRQITKADLDLYEQAVKIANSSIENSILYHQVEKSNKLKDEFLATVTHELRSPLMVIMGYSRMLLKRDLPEDVKKFIQAIHKSAEHQRILVEDLLEVSGISTGHIKFRPSLIHTEPLIQGAIDNISLTARSKSIRIITHIQNDSTILGDEFRLQQILNNLLSNSIKFTPEGGFIEVSSVEEGNFCKIIVKDNGKGMTPAFLPQVFDKFRQEEKRSSRSEGGLGLGLSIVKTLVGLHNGRIIAESDGENKGSTFTIYFPLKDQNEFELEQDTDEGDFSMEGLNVLLFEEEVKTAEDLSSIFEKFGAHTKQVTNDESAIMQLKENNFDLIVSSTDHFSDHHLNEEIEKAGTQHGKEIKKIALAKTTDCPDKDLEGSFDICMSRPLNPLLFESKVKKIISSI